MFLHLPVLRWIEVQDMHTLTQADQEENDSSDEKVMKNIIQTEA